MLRNPLRHAVSWVWMCQHGPLSLVGPPCLLSPYRYCVSTTRAFSVPGRREGGREEDGPRRAEGREQRGGEESEEGRANVGRTRFLRSPVVEEEKTCQFHMYLFFFISRSLLEALVEGVFATVNCQTGGDCQHHVINQWGLEKATGEALAYK